MKRLSPLTVLICLVLAIFTAPAEEGGSRTTEAPGAAPLTFTLEQAWRKMAEVNPGLQSLMIDQAAALRERNSRAAWIPGISAGAGVGRNSRLIGGFVDPEAEWSEAELWSIRGSVDLRFSLKPRSSLEERIKDLQWEQTVFQGELRQRDLYTSLKKLYHQILGGQKTIEVQEQAAALTRTRLEQIETQYNQGLRSDLDLLTARIAAARDLPALQKARTDQEKRWITLRQYLDLPADTEIRLAPGAGLYEPDLTSPSVGDMNLENSDAVRSARIQLELAKLNRELTARNLQGLSPGMNLDMSLGASAGLADLADPASLGSGNLRDSMNLSFSLTLPLDSRISGSSADITLARLDGEIEKRKLNLREARSADSGKFQALILDWELSEANLEVHELNVSLQEQNYQKVRENFDTGRASLLDLDNSRQELLKARLTRDNEILNRTLLLIDLERLTGGSGLPF